MQTLFSGPLALVAAAAGATFVTGLAGSPHCALMCGPLACAGLAGEPRARRRAALAWHIGRLAAYALAGALLGALGRGALAALQAPPARALPWVMAAGLVLSALEVGRRLPALPGAARLSFALARIGARLSPVARAALRGAATPFLPCGLLYGAFVVAIGAGSALGGLTVMAAFAAGAVPALTFVQANARWLTSRPGAERAARRVLPLVAAAVIIWRALAAPAAGQPPACHHAAASTGGAPSAHTLAENRRGASAGAFLR
jgi:sulfite exporter TauE/SafE